MGPEQVTEDTETQTARPSSLFLPVEEAQVIVGQALVNKHSPHTRLVPGTHGGLRHELPLELVGSRGGGHGNHIGYQDSCSSSLLDSVCAGSPAHQNLFIAFRSGLRMFFWSSPDTGRLTESCSLPVCALPAEGK